MALNKKGTSIIELIISIALLSIILTFMLKLLVDLNNARTNNTFAKDNQVVRSEIIRTIENDIKGKKIKSITSSTNNSMRRININFSDGTSSYIELSSDTLIYKKSNSAGKLPIRKWIMTDCALYSDKIYINKYLSKDKHSIGLVLNIQVHTINNENNTNRNNPLDDIQISYFYYENTILTINNISSVLSYSS